MPLRILNDLHEGAVRSAGTTTPSQWALRTALQQALAELLPTDESDVMILGDLFDTNNVALVDVLSTYSTLADWLRRGTSRKLYNVRGNHDASKSSNVLSSFDLLGAILRKHFPDRYVHIVEPQQTPYGYVVPHMPNQEQFDMALEAVPEVDYLLVHCNYNNHFAQQADQSLNLSEKQAHDCRARRIVFAHEHHGRNFGKILVPGNQVASSVSDWLNPQNKRYITLRGDGTHFFTECADRAVEYAEVRWDDLQQSDAKFVRIVGTATAEQAVDVLNAVNRYRKSSQAFVVSNAVAVAAEEGSVNFEESLQAVQVFSVLDALRKFLTAEEMAVLEKLC